MQPRMNADAVRMWAKFFSPNGSKDPVIEVPSEWMNFFTNILLSPTHFSWAKEFLSAQAWKLFRSYSIADGMKFSIPRKCQVTSAPSCSYLEMSNQYVREESEEHPDEESLEQKGVDSKTATLELCLKLRYQSVHLSFA